MKHNYNLYLTTDIHEVKTKFNKGSTWEYIEDLSIYDCLGIISYVKEANFNRGLIYVAIHDTNNILVYDIDIAYPRDNRDIMRDFGFFRQVADYMISAYTESTDE